MADGNAGISREERLAAKLRENLRRRKAQSREVEARERDARTPEAGDALPKPEPDE